MIRLVSGVVFVVGIVVGGQPLRHSHSHTRSGTGQ